MGNNTKLAFVFSLTVFAVAILVLGSHSLPNRTYFTDEPEHLIFTEHRMPLPTITFNALSFLGDWRFMLIQFAVLIAFYFASKQVFGENVAKWTVILTPFNFLIFFYSNRFLAEELTLVFAVATFYYVAKLVEKDYPDDFILALVFSALLIATKLSAWPILVGIWLAYLFVNEQKFSPLLLGAVYFMSFLSALFFIPAVKKFVHGVITNSGFFSTFIQTIPAFFLASSSLVLLTMAVLGVGRLFVEKRLSRVEWFFLLVPMFFVFTVSLFSLTTDGLTRYLFFTTFFWVCWSAFLFSRLSLKWKFVFFYLLVVLFFFDVVQCFIPKQFDSSFGFVRFLN